MALAIKGSPRGDANEAAIHRHAIAMVCKLVPHVPGPETFTLTPSTSFLSIRTDGRILGAVILHNYHRRTGCIEITAAAIEPTWASRSVLKTILRFIFAPAPEGLGCVRAEMGIPRRGGPAKRARRFCQGIGFKYEGTLRRRFGFDDAICLSMLVEDATKWTGKIDVQPRTTVAA